MAIVTVETLNQTDQFGAPPLGKEDGTAFGWFDRWNVGMTPDGKSIVDYSDWEARELHEMLRKDYKAQQIEKVLTLPILSAEHTTQPANGDKGEAAWLKNYWETDRFSGGCLTSLDQIIGLMTSAFYYKRAYFEKVWAVGVGAFAGKTVYADVAFRPQTTCRLMRNPVNGRATGFEQEAYYIGAGVLNPNKWPIQIRNNRAFVYTHGTNKDPLNGTSDMNVAFWAWQTKMKILMLWFQFLQGVSLPRTVVRAGDIDTATAVAQQISKLKSSGIIPVAAPAGPSSVSIDAFDVSGKGAEQFTEAINWLDSAATQSILAGFLDLTVRAATSGAGSYALSQDASDFFLQSLESKAGEMAEQIRWGLFAPLIFANFGPNAAVPKLVFEPLNDIDKSAALELLKQAMAAPPGGPVPVSFVAGLASQVAQYLGMDGEQARQDFTQSFNAAAAQAQAKALTEQGGASPTGQAVAGMSGAVKAAQDAIRAGTNPAQAHAQARRAASSDASAGAAAAKAENGNRALLLKHAKNVIAAKTQGAASL